MVRKQRDLSNSLTNSSIVSINVGDFDSGLRARNPFKDPGSDFRLKVHWLSIVFTPPTPVHRCNRQSLSQNIVRALLMFGYVFVCVQY